MANQRDIRNKIKSVGNTQKITRSMKLVANAKLKQATRLVTALKPYLDKIIQILAHLCQATTPEQLNHPYFKQNNKSDRVAIIVVAGERGLCGSFNTDIFKLTNKLITDFTEKKKQKVELFLLGKKTVDYYWKRQRELTDIRETLTDIGRGSNHGEVHRLLGIISGDYISGHFREVHIIYSRYISTIQNIPHHEMLFPADTSEIVDSIRGSAISPENYEIFPNRDALLQSLLPKYIETLVFRDIIQASACEHASRMVAMSGATDKAEEIIDDLKLEYNRARQGTITTQLIEIVSGVEALK